MAWAIVTIYTPKCAQMDPQQLPKTSKFYSKSKKCDIKKTLGRWVPPSPLVARSLTLAFFIHCRSYSWSYPEKFWFLRASSSFQLMFLENDGHFGRNLDFLKKNSRGIIGNF